MRRVVRDERRVALGERPDVLALALLGVRPALARLGACVLALLLGLDDAGLGRRRADRRAATARPPPAASPRGELEVRADGAVVRDGSHRIDVRAVGVAVVVVLLLRGAAGRASLRGRGKVRARRVRAGPSRASCPAAPGCCPAPPAASPNAAAWRPAPGQGGCDRDAVIVALRGRLRRCVVRHRRVGWSGGRRRRRQLLVLVRGALKNLVVVLADVELDGVGRCRRARAERAARHRGVNGCRGAGKRGVAAVVVGDLPRAARPAALLPELDAAATSTVCTRALRTTLATSLEWPCKDVEKRALVVPV